MPIQADVSVAMELVDASLAARLPQTVVDYEGVRARLREDMRQILQASHDDAYKQGVRDTQESYSELHAYGV